MRNGDAFILCWNMNANLIKNVNSKKKLTNFRLKMRIHFITNNTVNSKKKVQLFHHKYYILMCTQITFKNKYIF